jgi:hypothetical protein
MASLVAEIPNVRTGETYVGTVSPCHLNHAAGQIDAFYTHSVVEEILCTTTRSAAQV